jgi:uncharacterized FAD-dependent dehydrogenase
MIKTVEIKLSPAMALSKDDILQQACAECNTDIDLVQYHRVIRRSVDARSRIPFVVLRVELYIDQMPVPVSEIRKSYRQPDKNAPTVLIVGAGPAGYFAALECLAYGLKPIVLDRGKDARARRRDLRAIQQFGIVNPHSNYCFGEGGAGTYSDGKLWTNSKKRGDIEKTLRILYEHGAPERILIDTHPHIGSNKLPGIVQNIRQTILDHGGEVHFDAWVTDFILDKDTIKGAIVHDKQEYRADAVILATGHSARDIFHLLLRRGIHIESKPYALGVRAEHPQELIDHIQYKQLPRDPALPASSYKLVCQVGGRGVFSFCMCPGGLIVPAATAPGELVVNGMSMSRRDSAYANSGIVVAVEDQDLTHLSAHGVLAGLEFQKDVEQAVFQAGNGSQKAPAQRLTDFLSGHLSASLPDTSYIPGIYSAEIGRILPRGIVKRLQQGFLEFGKKMKGYIHPEAIIVATESRTSSPVRIPRNPENKMHVQIKNLYPCGEGAGYAGGIMSAAMDGQNTASAIALAMGKELNHG